MAEDISNKGDSIKSVANIVAGSGNTGIPSLEDTNKVVGDASEPAQYNSATELVEHLNQQEDDAATNYLNNNNIVTENNLYDDVKDHFDPVTLAEDPGLMDQIKSVIGSQMDFGKDKLTPKEFFPDIDKPIKVGTYSGKIIGTHNVYVGEGTLLPLSIIQNRNLAQKEAAKKRMEIAKKVRAYASIDAPAALQNQMDDQKNAMIEEYMEKTNGNFHLLADSSNKHARGFQKRREKLNSLNRNLWNSTKRAEQTKKDIKDPSKYVPDDVIDSTMETIAGTLDVEKLLNSPAAYEKWMKNEARNISWENMMKVVDDHLIDSAEKDKLPLLRDKYDLISTDKELQSHYKTIMTGGDYTHKASAYKTFVDTERIEAAVNAIFDNSNIYKGYTEDEKKKRKKDMLEYYTSKLGTQIETDLKSLNLKDSASDGGDGDGGTPGKTPLFTAYNKTWNEVGQEVAGQMNTTWSAAGRTKNTDPKAIQKAKDKTTSYLKEKTGITHKFDKNGRLVGEVPRTEDYNVSKTVGEVNYMVNGKLKSPQNLLNEIWSRKSSVKTGSADERTFIALTGKTIKQAEKEGKAVLNTSNDAFDPITSAKGKINKIERVYQTPTGERDTSGNMIYRDITASDLEDNPNILSAKSTKNKFRVYMQGFHNERIFKAMEKGETGKTLTWQKGDRLTPTGGYTAIMEADMDVEAEVNSFNQLTKSTSGIWEKSEKSGASIAKGGTPPVTPVTPTTQKRTR